MPVVSPLNQRGPWYLRSGHLQTVFPHYFRKLAKPPYTRERIELPDGDFLDLDWLRNGSDKLAIVSHGLEGSSQRDYVSGMTQTLARSDWDVLAWNMRGCSGEHNRLLRSYHSGESADLLLVIQHALKSFDYKSIVLIGFSLGGNITLKLLGEGANIPKQIKAAVTFSVPCDLAASADCLKKKSNSFYMHYFLKTLRDKITYKYCRFPDRISIEGLAAMKSFHEFDEAYTAPLHGFASALDYWRQASSKQFIPNISIPTMLISSADDPFIDQHSFPIEEAQANNSFYFELTSWGGHVGFAETCFPFRSYAERRCMSFLSDFVGS